MSIKKSISLIIHSGIDYEFRTTVVPGFLEVEYINEISSLLKGCKRYFLQQFQAVNSLDPGMCKLSPYPLQHLEKIRDMMLEYIPVVEIRD